MKQVVLTALAITALSGCVSSILQGYEGPVRPDEETALVRAVPAHGASLRAIQILSIQTPGFRRPISGRDVRLLPGDTCLEVRAQTISQDSSTGDLCFTADSGRMYELRVFTTVSTRQPEVQAVYSVFSYELVDLSSDEIVATVTF
jgi:hypothetical protein